MRLCAKLEYLAVDYYLQIIAKQSEEGCLGILFFIFYRKLLCFKIDYIFEKRYVDR